MFRPMRRNRQQMTEEKTIEILEHGTSGVLAVGGDEGYPYAVPLSYVYADGKIYFHCAKSGHKLDALRGNDKASFCVIDSDRIVPEEFTTYYRSAIAFGRVRIMESVDEKREALTLLAKRYTPDDDAGCRSEVEATIDRVCMLKMTVEHLSGKESKELAQG